jgi:deazaflavin-dependent oxidoreductase (nitroreductase family)
MNSIKTYRRSFADRIGDTLTAALVRAGVMIGTTSLLTVRGRKSGQLYTIPVLPVERDGRRWLVAPYGTMQWVRNIRAAGTATLTRGRRSETISVIEVPAHEAAPVLKNYLSMNVAKGVQAYFDVTKDSPIESFEGEASRHPVFEIMPADELKGQD